MSQVQHSLVSWLLSSTDVVPVTARSVEAFSRVQLLFKLGASVHGGVILGADGKLDQEWQARMSDVLADYQARLPDLSEATLAIGKELGISLRGWVVEEEGLRHYVVTKHNESDDGVLQTVLAEVQARGLLEGMHIHGNSNNLAFLPIGLSKQAAVQELLRRDRELMASARCWASVTASQTSASWTNVTCGLLPRAVSLPKLVGAKSMTKPIAGLVTVGSGSYAQMMFSFCCRLSRCKPLMSWRRSV
jgi:hypothetical protein